MVVDMREFGGGGTGHAPTCLAYGAIFASTVLSDGRIHYK